MRAGHDGTNLRLMVRLHRLALFAVVSALFVMLGAGCGGGQGETAALPVLRDLGPAADASRSVDSARFEMELEVALPGLSAPVAFSAKGAFDTPAGKSALTMDLGSFAELMSGFGSPAGNAPQGLSDPSKWKLEMLVDDTVAYMRVPFLSSQLPSGKDWVGIDLERAAKMQGLDLAGLGSLAQGSDPRATLAYLRSLAGELTRVGTEDVRGVPTTHYFAVIDWQKALERAAQDANQPGLLDQIQGLGGLAQNIPVDVWVDADNLVHRMTMDFSASSGSQQATASLSLELFDYGEPVVIEIPAADDVVDAFSLGG
jgi:hypothetical protein